MHAVDVDFFSQIAGAGTFILHGVLERGSNRGLYQIKCRNWFELGHRWLGQSQMIARGSYFSGLERFLRLVEPCILLDDTSSTQYL